jgi:hypothetical protein
MQVTMHEVHTFETNLFFVYRLSTQDDHESPIGHIVHYETFPHRALTYGFDPSHPDYHKDIIELAIHESLWWHPEMKGVHGENHSLVGQVHDRRVAKTVCKVIWGEGHLEAVKAAHPDPHSAIKALYAAAHLHPAASKERGGFR